MDFSFHPQNQQSPAHPVQGTGGIPRERSKKDEAKKGLTMTACEVFLWVLFFPFTLLSFMGFYGFLWVL